MIAFIRPRLRKPLGIALAGTVFAAAWALRGGDAWQLSVAMVVTVLVSAVTIYVRAGQDSDDGALAGSRADERQKMMTKMRDAQKATGDKIEAVLTADQQKQWKEMQGAPFKFPAMQPGRGGPGGGRRGNPAT